jgi:hypothetical protein
VHPRPPPDLLRALDAADIRCGKPASRALKAAVIDYARPRRSAGHTYAAIAKPLRLRPKTLRNWLVRHPNEPLVRVHVEPPMDSRPVAEPTEPPASLSLDCPGGFVLRGLTVTTALELLRRLQ